MATLGSKEIGQGRLSFSHFKHFSHPFSLYSIHSQVSIQSHVLFSPSVTESRFILLAAQQASESERGGVEARKMTLIEELADWEDGKLAPQNNYLPGVWIPGSFIDQRERSNEELKSKGRIERERQWASKVKGSSVFQNISKGMSSLWKRCVNLFYSQVVRDKLSPGAEPRHCSLQSSKGTRSPGKPLSTIIIIKGSQRKSFQYGVRVDFLPITVR